MPDLAGDTLGEKHRHYNKIVQKAIGKNAIDEDISDDLKELIKIDVASNDRNVDYILKVLQSEDLLYVSRAIKKCAWLVTDNQYTHIINPTYLKDELLPFMTTKASTFLIKHIRNNIKDETRAELFFLSEDSPVIALKWLPKCSVIFIESVVNKDDYYYNIKPKLLKKLCERSINILKIAIEKERLPKIKIEAVTFVRKINISMYLDAVDRLPAYETINFDAKTTDLIMMNCRHRVINNFDKYATNIHIPTFSKYLQKEEVKEFLDNQVVRLELEDYKSYKLRSFFTYDNLHHLVRKYPQHEQFEFVKKVFMSKLNNSGNEDLPEKFELARIAVLCQVYKENDYDWYQIAPFDVAFEEIKKRINTTTLNEKYSLLTVLVKCTGQKQQHLQTVLSYYLEKHLNDSVNLRRSFVSNLLSQTNFYKYENKTWDMLQEIFKTMDVYTTSDTDVEKIVESIIIYNLVHKWPIPAILENKIAYNNLHKYKYKLEKDVSDIIFKFVYNHMTNKVDSHKILNKEDLKALVEITKDLLQLLTHWNKSITDYPKVLDTIKNIIQLTTKNCWKIDMSPIYDVNKSWRKYLFEESLLIKQSEEVILNALKHDPKLLKRHTNQVETIYFNKNIMSSSKRLLRKVRLYWSQSIAKEWTHMYEMRLKSSSDHDVAIFSLFMLMHQQQCLDYIYKYKPEEEKVDISKLGEEMFSLQKNIAKNMHFCRPQPPPDAVLLYAKGDYLKHTLPSVLAIFYNLKSALSMQYIKKLLYAPVSLQKHGIRFAVSNIENNVLMQLFYECWSKSENVTIRATLFKFTLKLLCHKKNENNVDDIWKLLKMFIENLTFEEDKSIYDLLHETSNVPFKIKPSFIETCYTFLKSYLPHSKTDEDKLKWRMNQLLNTSREVMEYINEEFIVNVVKEFVDSIFFNDTIEGNGNMDVMIPIMSAYFLCNKEEYSQTSKYNDILYPILKRSSGELNHDSIKKNLYALLRRICRDLTVYSLKTTLMVPMKLFSDVHEELIKFMEVSQHYALLRQWELTLELSKMIQKTIINGRTFPDDWMQDGAVEPVEYASICVEILKKDINERSPFIFLLFDHLLLDTFNNLRNTELELIIYKQMLSDQQFTPAFMALAKQASYRTNDQNDWSEIHKIISDHPSLEVKMHYNYFSNRDRY